MMYEDESLDVLHLFGSDRLTSVNGPSALVQNFVPTPVSSPSSSIALNLSDANLVDFKTLGYTLSPGSLLERWSLILSPVSTSLVVPSVYTLKSTTFA